MEEEEKSNSFGLEGNQERYDDNVDKFLKRIQDFKKNHWNSVDHIVDVSITNFILLEHFLTIIVSKVIEIQNRGDSSFNKEEKIEEVFENLLSAFSIYKEDLLEILAKNRDEE
jgi:hypothetical protein